MKISLAEMFYSIQGEGATMGVPAVFLRLGGCNLLCGGAGTDDDRKLHDGAKWRCDTIEVWQNATVITPKELLNLFQVSGMIDRINLNDAHLVITGGEPVLQAAAIIEFLNLLMQECSDVYIELETNGTIENHDLFSRVNQINCSPKLANSGMPAKRRIFPEVLEYITLNPKGYLKFVIADTDDVAEVLELVEDYSLPTNQIYLMPAADNVDDLNRLSPMIAEVCKEEGFRFSSRLQVAIWNTCTGV